MNPSSPIEQLKDDETLAPETVAKMAQEPVSQLWAVERCRTCPTTRTVHRWNIVACILLGAVLAMNTLGWAYAKSMIRQAVIDGLSVDLKSATVGTDVSIIVGAANAAER